MNVIISFFIINLLIQIYHAQLIIRPIAFNASDREWGNVLPPIENLFLVWQEDELISFILDFGTADANCMICVFSILKNVCCR